MCYVESPVYSLMDVVVGQSVELLCNTSLTSDIMWTYDNDDDGYVHYVYWNEHIDNIVPRLFIKPTANNFHILGIADAESKHSGLYDCYDGTGTRKLGYQLTVVGMRSMAVYCNVMVNCYWKHITLITFALLLQSEFTQLHTREEVL